MEIATRPQPSASRRNEEGVPCRRLALSDTELDVLMNLAQPLDPAMRDPFLRAVAIELARYQPEAIGPGMINRIGRQLQRQFMTPSLDAVPRSRAWG
jgi:hypothetical protein